MMKAILTFPICLLLAITVQAIDIKDKDWHTGVLYLKNSEVVKGKIRLTTQPSLVQCKTEGKVLTYSPYQIKVFQYYDEESGRNKIYTSVLDFRKGNLGQRKFLEIILTGKICILRNEYNAVKQLSPIFDPHAGKDAIIQHNTYVEVTQYEYYVFAGEGLFKMKNFEKDIYTLCLDARQQIDDFIASHQLNIKDNIYDQMKVVEYYNKLHKNESLSLSTELALHE